MVSLKLQFLLRKGGIFQRLGVQGLDNVDVFVGVQVSLHTDTMHCVFLERGEPKLDDLEVGVVDADGAAVGTTLKVFFALGVDEGRSDHGPALAAGGEGHAAGDGHFEVVGGSQGKVDKEVEVGGFVGTELDLGYQVAMGLGVSKGGIFVEEDV